MIKSLMLISYLMATPYRMEWMLGSYVEIKDSGNAGCPYIIEFYNKTEHGDRIITEVFVFDEEEFNLTIKVGWGDADDVIQITPPDGMIAYPDVLSVPEKETASAEICHALF